MVHLLVVVWHRIPTVGGVARLEAEPSRARLAGRKAGDRQARATKAYFSTSRWFTPTSAPVDVRNLPAISSAMATDR